MWPRYIAPRLERALDRSPVVYLTGARQVGKTTLARAIAERRRMVFFTLDDPTILAFARRDPKGFVAELKDPAVIDEVQRVPELLLAIKLAVDENRSPGRFLLTGSVGLKSRSSIAGALVGRAEYLFLRPLAEAEIAQSKTNLVSELFRQEPRFPNLFPEPDLLPRLCRGGYPAAAKLPPPDRTAWLLSYVTALIERDLVGLVRIEHPESALDLLMMQARLAATPQNISAIGSELGLAAATARRYAELFERLYLVERLPAWSKNPKKRLARRPKLLLNDSALMLYLSGIACESLQENRAFLGRVLENFVLAELLKHASWLEDGPRVFHLRTASGHEVDAVIEARDGRIVGVEVKLARSVAPADLRGLRTLRESAGQRFHLGIVFYGGEQVIPLEERIWALPLAALWQERL